MTNNYHTPPADGSPANMSVIRAPLSELDAKITEHESRVATLESEFPTAPGNPTEYLNGDGEWTVPAGTGASVEGHVIKDEGVALPQRASVDFVGAGVMVTNEAGGTQVYIPGGVTDHGVLTGLNDPDHIAGSVGFTGTDKLLGRSSPGAGAGEEIPLTAAGRSLIAAADLAAQKLLLEISAANGLINGGFDFFQYINPTTPTAMTDDVYNGPDRWYSLVEGAGATINRNAGIGTSRYACKIIAGGTVNRYGIAQIEEADNSISKRGQTVTAQFRIKPVNNAGSGTRKYRIAILEWTGTPDVVTSELVADWTSGIFTTAGFFASTNKALVATASVTATHNTETILSVSGVVSASCNNLIVFIWAEDVPTHASDYVLIGEAGEYTSSTTQIWSPRQSQQELALCRRRFRSSYALDAAPGTPSAPNYIFALAYTTARLWMNAFYEVEMASSPTFTIYSVAGTLAKVGKESNGSDTGTTVSVLIGSSKILSLLSDSGAGFTVGLGYAFHYTAQAEL